MRLGDTINQARFRATLRDWLAAHVPESAPGSWSKALHAAGYAGLTWPEKYGGRGLTAGYQAIFVEECARAGAPDHVNVIGLNMVGPTVIRFGTPDQRDTHLPRILSGDAVFCQGFSEPDAGSDLAAVRTRADADPGGGYRLTGEKVWSSYAHLADHCLLLARTSQGEPRHRGLTCFLLDMRTPGVTVRPLRQLTGDSDFNQILLDDVRVPAEAVLGPVDDGWRVAMTTLDDGWRVAMTTLAHERGTFGITLTARLAAELDRLVATVRELGATADPLVRREVAELHVQVQGLRYTGYRALAALEQTGTPGPESSILKLRWSLANQRLTALATRLLGGAAALDGYWQHQRLSSRTNTIEGGTSEILRGIIAERVLGLPRSR